MTQLPGAGAATVSATGSWSMGAGKAERVVVVGAGMAGLVAARLLHDSGFAVTVLEARGASAAAPGPTIRSARRSISAVRGCMASTAIRSRCGATSSASSWSRSQGERLLIDKRATSPTREGQRRRAIMGRMAFKAAIEWASWKSKALTRVRGPRSISVQAGGRAAAARRRGCRRSTGWWWRPSSR